MQKCKYDVKTNTMTSMCKEFAYVCSDFASNLIFSNKGNGARMKLNNFKGSGEYHVSIDYCPWCGEAISNRGILNR